MQDTDHCLCLPDPLDYHWLCLSDWLTALLTSSKFSSFPLLSFSIIFYALRHGLVGIAQLSPPMPRHRFSYANTGWGNHTSSGIHYAGFNHWVLTSCVPSCSVNAEKQGAGGTCHVFFFLFLLWILFFAFFLASIPTSFVTYLFKYLCFPPRSQSRALSGTFCRFPVAPLIKYTGV